MQSIIIIIIIIIYIYIYIGPLFLFLKILRIGGFSGIGDDVIFSQSGWREREGGGCQYVTTS